MELTLEDLKCQTSINYDKMLCFCKQVSYRDAYNAIVKHKITTLEELVKITGVSTGCGGCHNKAEKLLEYAKKCQYEPLKI